MSKLWIVAFCCVLSTGCERFDGEIAITSSIAGALTANPCTAVALTTPVQGFAAQVGGPIALTASATCPVGVTPEFEYWTKPAGAQNWTTLTGASIALGVEYVPAGTSVTEPVASTPCFAVAVRATGSTDSYQAHSSGACGTATGAAPSPSITRVIPAVPPQVTGPVLQAPVFISGSGSASRPLVVALPTTVGETIVALRARVTDNSIDQTQVHILLADTADFAQSFNVLSASGSSLGDGTEQTIADTTAQIVLPGHQYFALVTLAQGQSICAVWRLELQTSPPAG